MDHHVVLVPGFFGFGKLGELRYFLGVAASLQRAFTRAGFSVEVHEVPTLPTASIRHRAARVREVLARVTAQHAGPVHIVGHSTGGLDARVAIAPTASLPTTAKIDDYHRVRTIVTVSTPHHGTPLAAFFGGSMGKPVLRLSAMTALEVLRHGRAPVGLALKVGHWLTRADDALGLDRTVVDQLYSQLFADFDDERRAAVIEFFHAVSTDQSLVFQLTPAGCDLLNACTADPDGVHYGSVLTRARPPRAWNVLVHGHDVVAQSLHALYTLLHVVTAGSLHADLPEPTPEQHAALLAAYGEPLRRGDSDGIVPTLSQLWGPVIHATQGDHLDVIGNYGHETDNRVYPDWLPSESGFDTISFERAWSSVAEFILHGAER